MVLLTRFLRRRYPRWDHTAQERAIILRYGGTPLRRYGYDGLLRGRPVEVRSARRDDRFRIQENVHRTLVRRRGSYIFLNDGRSRRLPAAEVSRLLGRGPWFRDRRYPHRFLRARQVF